MKGITLSNLLAKTLVAILQSVFNSEIGRSLFKLLVGLFFFGRREIISLF